ncbi:MAG: ABC transporter substrate-binding protein [Ideonella sp.]|nr:ABC transporter substrate-binding protein [Ideonella sp.]
MKSIRLLVCLLSTVAVTLPGPAAAQAFPSKPVRLVVPFAPGGTTDLLARIIAEKIGPALGQTVVVENKAGAGGAIGAGEVAKSAPDGYTLLMSSVSTMAANPAINPATPYDPNKDFTHIINVAATPNVIAVHPSFPARDYRAFVGALSSKPGQYSFASAGNGSVGHLLGELYKRSAMVYLTHIPYRGSGPALNDVVAGQVPIIVDNLPSALPFIKDKRLVPIVVAAPARVAALPEVPTLAEVGLAPVNRMSFLGVSAPKGTPKVVVDKLNAAIKSALADPAVKERIEATGAIAVGNSADEYQQQVSDELAIYKRVVLEQKLTLE